MKIPILSLPVGTSPIHHLRRRFDTWVRQRIPPSNQVTLGHHNIFIIPNRQGMGFACAIVLMLVAAINYEASLAYVLVFWLVSMFLACLLFTFRNLAGLKISVFATGPVFAGEHAEFVVLLHRTGERPHEAVDFSFADSDQARGNLLEHQEQRLSLFVPASRRGWLRPGRLRIETVFPLGICRAWSWLYPRQQVLVYPRPLATETSWHPAAPEGEGESGGLHGGEDFHGLRDYQPGDSLRHVAWKQLARGQGMYTKQFADAVDEHLWLEWEMFPGCGTEERLSRLTWCVLNLQRQAQPYGLRIPGSLLPPAQGEAHAHTCLQALALFGQEDLEEGGA